MARNSELIEKRNKDIETEYLRLSKKYPKYKEDAILEMLENRFYITSSTILSVLSGEYERKKRKKG